MYRFTSIELQENKKFQPAHLHNTGTGGSEIGGSRSEGALPLLDEKQTRDSTHRADFEILKLNCPDIELVSRVQWGAEPPKAVEYLSVAVELVIYHHTERTQCFSIENCSRIVHFWQGYHQVYKDWYDIAYSFLIGGDGSVYQGRGFGTVGAHTLLYNDKSVSFAFIGNFTYHGPNKNMLKAAENLIKCGIKLGKIRANYTLHGQRDANRRDCPGEAFYKQIRKSRRFGGRLTPYIYKFQT
uniref:Putative peptidoglycan recognition protein n=1 Tax=Ixodes ricinus TaxID=34613 RepID=A0A0K8RGC5_IXORI